MIAYLFSKLHNIKKTLNNLILHMPIDLYGNGSLGNVYYGSGTPNGDGTYTSSNTIPEGYTTYINNDFSTYVSGTTIKIKDQSLLNTDKYATDSVIGYHFLPKAPDGLQYNNLYIGPQTILAASGDLTYIYVKDTLTIHNGWLTSNGTHTNSQQLSNTLLSVSDIRLKTYSTSHLVTDNKNFIYIKGNGCGGTVMISFSSAKSGAAFNQLETCYNLESYIDCSGGAIPTNCGGMLVISARNIVLVNSASGSAQNVGPRITAFGGAGDADETKSGLSVQNKIKTVKEL